MPTDYIVTDTELTSVADAIRTKGGTSAALSFPSEFVSAIGAISSGGITPVGTVTINAAGNTDVTYYATAYVAAGSAATPATSITANPTISVNASTGLITASVSGSQSVTPNVSAGYVTAGTAGNVTVTGSKTYQLTAQAAKTVTPTTSAQTAVAANSYTTGAVTVAAIPSNYKDTTNADAVAADVRYGKIIVNGTGYVTGSMLNANGVSF